MIWKFLFIVVLCDFLAAEKVKFPPEVQDMMTKLHAECLQKQGLTEDGFKAFDVTKKTPELMCYLKCVFTESKWMNDDEVIQYDFLKENLHEVIKPIALPHLDNCGKAAVGSQDCEKSYNFFHCMNQADPENFVLL